MLCNSAYSSHNDCSSPTCCQIHAIKNLNMSCYPSKTPQNDKFAVHCSCFKAKFFLRLSRSYICQRKGSCFLLVPLPFSVSHVQYFTISWFIYVLTSSFALNVCSTPSTQASRKTWWKQISANPPEILTWLYCCRHCDFSVGLLRPMLFVNEIWRGRQCRSLNKTLKCVASDCSYVESIQRRPEYILKKVFF